MKVIHICQRDDPATGGAVRVAFEYVKRLPSYGVDARLLFLYGNRGSFGTEKSTNCHYLGLKNSSDLHRLMVLSKYINQEKPDIVHFHDDLLWPHLLTLKHNGYKKIIHAHGGGTPKPQPVKLQLLYACQRFSGDAVVCITQEALSSQRKNIGYRSDVLHVISNGIDLSHFSQTSSEQHYRAREILSLPQQVPVVGFIGRLHNIMKGADDFLHVMAALPPHYWGLVVGDGPDLDALKQQCQYLKINDRVRFTGFLDDPLNAYHAMNVFCFTSRFEPFGLVILEAMASHIPVVGFRCPGGSDEILTPETGLVIENRNVASMAEAVQSVIEKKTEEVDARILTAYNFLKKQFNWDLSTQKLVNLYYTLA